MIPGFKPMLACEADLTKLRFPLIASPKLDGVRALIIDGVVMSRSLKPIPNKHVQKLFGRPELEGLDGELIVGSPTDPQCYQNTSGAVRRSEGEPEVTFYVFDSFLHPRDEYQDETDTYGRAEEAYDSASGEGVKWLTYNILWNTEELEKYEEKCLNLGYEGLILRDPNSPYKFGRSTAKEGYLLKLKRFKDSEARILAVEELMSNQNEAKKNALGQTERSTHRENLVPAGTMGRLYVEDVHSGVRFHIGTGFTKEQRDWWWDWKLNVHRCQSLLIKYKFFPVGVKDLPRHPVYLGLRDDFDMSK